MAQFALYHYELSAFDNKQPRLFVLNNPEHSYKSMEQLFESFLPGRGSSLDVKEVKVYGKGEDKVTTYEPHGSEVLQNKNHIIAFKVQKNGTKKIETVNWETETVEHHPNVKVLIDNRPDRQIIAIENKSAFKADKAFELLKKDFNLKLKDYYVRFDCYALLKKAGFWDSVNEIKHRFGDFIKRVQFDFIGCERKGNKITDKLESFLKTINAAHGGMFMDFCDADELQRAEEDIENMARLCYTNKRYNLSVKFRDFGTFCFGQDIKAQWGLDDEKIEAFSEKYTQLDAFAGEGGDKAFQDIADWFDKINVLFADYIANGKKEYHIFESYIIKKNNIVGIKQLLHNYIDSQDKPQKILMPIAAAVHAGCMYKPNLDDFNIEFDKKIKRTSYNRYVKEHDDVENPYEGISGFMVMVEEFRKLQ